MACNYLYTHNAVCFCTHDCLAWHHGGIHEIPAHQLHQRGLGARDAIIRAGVTRFRPVILTAGGRSSQWWGPMGIAIVFGLAFATILTLVVVPLMISLI